MMFQRFLKWLGAKLFPRNPAPEPNLSQTKVRVHPPSVRPRSAKPELVKFRAEMGSTIADGGPGKNVLQRSKYVREDTGTHDNLKILDYSVLEEEEEAAGIDPYNTGRFDRSKSWQFRSRK
ncbi:MAG: hypothetical protein WD448_10810 [Woeseia sp.]